MTINLVALLRPLGCVNVALDVAWKSGYFRQSHEIVGDASEIRHAVAARFTVVNLPCPGGKLNELANC